MYFRGVIMLSNKTKLERINEKLGLFDLRLEFGCFDLQTYRPMLRGLNHIYSQFRNYNGVEVHIGYKVENNKVIFFVKEIKPHGFRNKEEFTNFVMRVQEIEKIMNYCTHLGLEIPEYKNDRGNKNDY